jgi:hypothetical protein
MFVLLKDLLGAFESAQKFSMQQFLALTPILFPQALLSLKHQKECSLLPKRSFVSLFEQPTTSKLSKQTFLEFYLRRNTRISSIRSRFSVLQTLAHVHSTNSIQSTAASHKNTDNA